MKRYAQRLNAEAKWNVCWSLSGSRTTSSTSMMSGTMKNLSALPRSPVPALDCIVRNTRATYWRM